MCSGCGKPTREPKVDHIVPCGSMDDLNAFKDRLFVAATGLQILDAQCHMIKGVQDKALKQLKAQSEKEGH